MADEMRGVPIGDLPGIESVPDDSLLVVEFLGKAYNMPGAVLKQLFQDILDAMGTSIDDVTEARLTAAIETVLASGKYNGVSPAVEVTTDENGKSVLHVVDAFGIKDYPVEVQGASNAVQYVKQTLTKSQQEQARKNIGISDVNNVVIATISGGYSDGYEVTLDGESVTSSDIKEIIDKGGIVIGIASNDMEFPLVGNVRFSVPKNTTFQCGVRSAYFYVDDFEKHYQLTYTDGAWVGSMFANQFVLSLNNSSDRAVEWSGKSLTVAEARSLLIAASQVSLAVHCYQYDAVFYTDDGVARKPAAGTQFFVDYEKAAFVCEHEGYEYSLGLYNPATGTFAYTPTAKKTTPYRTAESKADDLEVDGGELFLLSGTERISGGVKLPTNSGGNGVTFTPSVDAAGNLSWTNDGDLPNPETVNIRGSNGEAATIEKVTAEVDGSYLAQPTVTVTPGGTANKRTFHFSFKGLRGLFGGGSGGGGTTVQADWSVNDPNDPSHVKERTHWKEVFDGPEGEVISETEVSFTSNIKIVTGAMSDAIHAGGLYIVTWNGTEYQCVGKSGSDGNYIGNGSFMNAGSITFEDTGEPFCVLLFGGTYYQLWKGSTTAETITIKVVGKKETVWHKLDSRFLNEALQFGETTIYGDTQTWDGNTDSMVCVEIDVGVGLCKVSDAVITKEDCANGFILTIFGETIPVDGETAQSFFFDDGFMFTEYTAVVPFDNYFFEDMGLTFPKAGVYFVYADGAYVSELVIPGCTAFTKTEVTKINNKFLPEMLIKMTVNFTQNENGDWVSDKTYAEVEEALANGYTVNSVAYDGTLYRYMPLVVRGTIGVVFCSALVLDNVVTHTSVTLSESGVEYATVIK